MYRMLTLVFLATVLIALGCSNNPVDSQSVAGDLNSDGSIDMSDIVLCIENPVDVNSDGVGDIDDAYFLVDYLFGPALTT